MWGIVWGVKIWGNKKRALETSKNPFNIVAGATRLELATSGVTGRRSNQLNYAPEAIGYMVGDAGLEPATSTL
jgi:hypothetical protein